MKRRLVTCVCAALVIGAGALWAQAGELKDFLDRGRALTKSEKFEQALPYLLFALELGEKEFGMDSPAVVPMLNDLGEVYAKRSDYGDAEPLFKRSLEIQEREVSRYQVGMARTLNNLGSIYEATERAPEARKLYQRVVTALEPALGADNPNIRTARLRLAKLGETASAAPSSEPLPEPPPEPSPEPALAATAPPFRVHLTSIRNAGRANSEWRRLQQAYPALLAELEVTVTRVDLGAKGGVWYRIQGGPLGEPEARALCAGFAQRGVWCAIIRGKTGTAPPAPAQVATSGRNIPAPPPPATREQAAGFRIHLTSIRDSKNAEGEWARLRGLFAELLKELDLMVERADLGKKRGTWYRIQGGPLSRAEARTRCSAFAALQVWCQVVPPPGNAAENLQRQVALRVRRRGGGRLRGTRRPKAGHPPEPGARRLASGM